MPNPVPLATKEEEERRAWVTAHHEVVRLIKECFGDRFSNNEIFDRLKISRRTGYRALGNDERIGKAPGRKPKILEQTIQEMTEYIEAGGCTDVGNVWKHLATRYAPDCNPKTVQDAVKKAGFKNYQGSVKLEPLLDQQLNENESAPAEEEAARQLQDDQAEEQHAQQVQQARQAQQAEQAHREEQQRQHQERYQQRQQQHQHHNVFDPALQQQNPQDILRTAIATYPQEHVRYIFTEIVTRNHDAMMLANQMFFQPAFPSQQPAIAPPVAQMALPAHMVTHTPMHHPLHATPMSTPEGGGKRRIANCRRCGVDFDRADSVGSRECLYHKGSPQKIDATSDADSASTTLETIPEAFIWSCCGGNGSNRGCCHAMHTTKKKRKYTSKKRDATAAGLDDEGNPNGNDDGGLQLEHAGGSQGDGGDDGDEDDANETGLDDATLIDAHVRAHAHAPSDQHQHQQSTVGVGTLTPQQMGNYAQAFGSGFSTVNSQDLGGVSADDVNMNVMAHLPTHGMELQMAGLPGQDPNIDAALQGGPGQQQHQQQADMSQHAQQHHHHQQLGMAALELPQDNMHMMQQVQQQQHHPQDYKQHEQEYKQHDPQQHHQHHDTHVNEGQELQQQFQAVGKSEG